MISNEDAARQIAAHLKKLMDARKISVRKLAKQTGDAHTSIANVLTGEHAPSSGILARIAEAFGVSTDDLIFGPRKKSRRTA